MIITMRIRLDKRAFILFYSTSTYFHGNPQMNHCRQHQTLPFIHSALLNPHSKTASCFLFFSFFSSPPLSFLFLSQYLDTSWVKEASATESSECLVLCSLQIASPRGVYLFSRRHRLQLVFIPVTHRSAQREESTHHITSFKVKGVLFRYGQYLLSFFCFFLLSSGIYKKMR